jgi:hypothetical protein
LRTVSIAFFLLLAFTFSSAAQTSTKKKEQSFFNLESNIQNRAKIPNAILNILRKDEDTQMCFQREEPEEFSSDWYAASVIHLERKESADLVIMPTNACLWGANIGPMWVFKRVGLDYVLVLKIHALGFEVLDSRTKDVRDIKVYAASAIELYTTLCRFDGKRYRIISSKTSKL